MLITAPRTVVLGYGVEGFNRAEVALPLIQSDEQIVRTFSVEARYRLNLVRERTPGDCGWRA